MVSTPRGSSGTGEQLKDSPCIECNWCFCCCCSYLSSNQVWWRVSIKAISISAVPSHKKKAHQIACIISTLVFPPFHFRLPLLLFSFRFFFLFIVLPAAKGRQISDVFPLSRIIGLSFGSTFLHAPLLFCLVPLFLCLLFFLLWVVCIHYAMN